MSDEKQRENGAEMEETQEKEPLQEEVEKKSKSPENSQDFQNSDSENEEDQDLPFPGFTAKSLYKLDGLLKIRRSVKFGIIIFKRSDSDNVIRVMSDD
ncbi:Hypothetical predicted protein, partial [Mytilus galloprovincialis]